MFRLLSSVYPEGFSVNGDKSSLCDIYVSQPVRELPEHTHSTHSKEPNSRVRVLSFLWSRSLEELLSIMIIHTPKESGLTSIILHNVYNNLLGTLLFLFHRFVLKA